MSTITPNIQVPPRSRNFTTDDAKRVLALLKGETPEQGATFNEDGKLTAAGTPAKTVGFGEFETAGAARSAGVTLNRLLIALGADHKYAVTSFQRDGKYVGVMRNERAKERPEASGNGKPKAGTKK